MSRSRWVWMAVVCLLVVQAAQMAFVVHRESLTFDEDNHMFAGYMMWHTGDYGLNPEHPPLVKLLATIPPLGRNLWVPPLKGRQLQGRGLPGRTRLAGAERRRKPAHGFSDAPGCGSVGAGIVSDRVFCDAGMVWRDGGADCIGVSGFRAESCGHTRRW